MTSKDLRTQISIVSRFVSDRTELVRKFISLKSGFRFCQAYTELVDRFTRRLFFEAGLKKRAREPRNKPFIILALGSYGRRELCFGSDIDFMVIHEGREDPELNEIIPRALYPLWDAHLEVGHATLTIPACIRLAMEDFTVLTALLDARPILGSRPFYDLFEQAFLSRLFREREKILKHFMAARRKQEEQFRTEAFFVEPDIKEGPGGLRDLHFMNWMARIYFSCVRFSQIRRFAVFSHFDLYTLAHSKSFLLKVRNQLHFLAQRKEDRLLLTYQKDLADRLGYTDDPNLSAPLKFMKNVYRHLNRIRYGYEAFQVKALDIIHPSPADENASIGPFFQVTNGNLVLRQDLSLKTDPGLILKALEQANEQGLFWGSGLIWEARRIIARSKRRLLGLQDARPALLRVLSRPRNPKIIRLALEIGLLELFIPEFKRIRNLPELGFYHVDTVDIHSLRTAEVLEQMSEGAYDERWPIFRAVFEGLPHPERLFLAGVLHDVGKGYPDDHSVKGAALVRPILRRFGIDRAAAEAIAALVRHHLLLARVSQRRDLSDEKTSVQTAQTVQSTELLDMLFLLTAADSFATGPMARTEWKLHLITELYAKTRRILEKDTLATPHATRRFTEQKKQVLKSLKGRFPARDVRRLLEQISSRYFIGTPIEDVVAQVALALDLGESPFAWSVRRRADAPVTRILQCIRDRRGLFSDLAGVFTLNNIGVLSAQIFTLKNGLAFDIYEVTNPLDPLREDETWGRVREQITQVLRGEFSLDERIAKKEEGQLSQAVSWITWPRSVQIDNEASDFFTIVEVAADARMGLLYRIAKVLTAHGLDIRFATVNRDQEKLLGVFYVQTPEGEKLFDPLPIDRVRRSIQEVIQ
ncbi:Bifunctional uridylyltransferase/uridylyl-removing enzyme [uncultured Desulfatiglans sp.]|uniref:Bifunctional uridylyltransferase/uridylyl-removing enzyme n=1 Tax=Uncultured Desulfatiglans sp. TaxID=1748965 RepID=A0A653AB88_UNCDX|nr:Bifunctional uridylyltransferase/uridylyl-removing enzyme [uncultured Desulfatiglans sp.]